MKADYRSSLNIAPNERLLFTTPTLKNYAVGVLRSGNKLHFKVLHSTSNDFKDGPADLTYFPEMPPEALRLIVKVYEAMLRDDWQNYLGGVQYVTWRT